MRLLCRMQFVVAVAAVIGLTTACNDVTGTERISAYVTDSSIHSVIHAPEHAALVVGGSMALAVSVDAGAGVTDRNVVWSSSDSTVVSVSSIGSITGRAVGHATITASSKVDHNVKGASVIDVLAPTASPSRFPVIPFTGLATHFPPTYLLRPHDPFPPPAR